MTGRINFDAHHVDDFATYPSANFNDFKSVCLASSPIKNEKIQTASEHIVILSYTKGFVGKSFDKVTILVAVTYSTDKKIDIKLRRPLIGSLSYRIQPAFPEIFFEQEDVINGGHSPMVKLRTSLLRAKLKNITPLCAK